MRAVIRSTRKLQGEIVVPGSKSQTVRAFVMALLAKGRSVLHAVNLSDDVNAVIGVCRMFGATVTEMERCECGAGGDGKRCFSVESGGPPFEIAEFVPGHKPSVIFTGNSGITTHFVLPLLGLTRCPEEVKVFDVGNQMRRRGVERFFSTLRQLGMVLEEGEDGGWPLRVSGTLKGGKAEVWGGTSQYVSALLLCGGYAEHGVELTAPELCEKSYVQMTLEWLEKHLQGTDALRSAPCVEHSVRTGRNCGRLKDTYTLQPGTKYAPFEYTVPGDFSSAAAIMAAAALCEGEVRLRGLDMSDAQPDKALLEILREMGVDVELSDGSDGGNVVTVRGGGKLEGVELNAGDIPDLVPVLAVLGSQAAGQMKIFHVANAREKETDRLRAMTAELAKMGADIEERSDGLVVQGFGGRAGVAGLRGAKVDGHGDHRTVMALAVAGMLADGETVIEGAECVRKTYPTFWDDMGRLGMEVTLVSGHLIFIGFKGVGKSTVGRAVAEKLGRNFLDMDEEIEKRHAKKYSNHSAATDEFLTCRKIFEIHGEEFFRELESSVLKELLSESLLSSQEDSSGEKSFILAVGGGAPLREENRSLLERLQREGEVCIVHVTAPPETVFERIMAQGRPAFFPKGLSDREAFEQLWQQRLPLYENMAHVTVENSGTLEDALEKVDQKFGNLSFF